MTQMELLFDLLNKVNDYSTAHGVDNDELLTPEMLQGFIDWYSVGKTDMEIAFAKYVILEFIEAKERERNGENPQTIMQEQARGTMAMFGPFIKAT